MFRIVLVGITMVNVVLLYSPNAVSSASQVGSTFRQPLQNFEPHLGMITLGWPKRPLIAKGASTC